MDGLGQRALQTLALLGNPPSVCFYDPYNLYNTANFVWISGRGLQSGKYGRREWVFVCVHVRIAKTNEKHEDKGWTV